MRKGDVAMFFCPVCYYDKMREAPADFNICECCGTEFGNDDEVYTHADLRADWIARGANWFYGQSPRTWNPWGQLAEAKASLPYNVSVQFTASLFDLAEVEHYAIAASDNLALAA
jgi:hypothetical protein